MEQAESLTDVSRRLMCFLADSQEEPHAANQEMAGGPPADEGIQQSDNVALLSAIEISDRVRVLQSEIEARQLEVDTLRAQLAAQLPGYAERPDEAITNARLQVAVVLNAEKVEEVQFAHLDRLAMDFNFGDDDEAAPRSSGEAEMNELFPVPSPQPMPAMPPWNVYCDPYTTGRNTWPTFTTTALPIVTPLPGPSAASQEQAEVAGQAAQHQEGQPGPSERHSPAPPFFNQNWGNPYSLFGAYPPLPGFFGSYEGFPLPEQSGPQEEYQEAADSPESEEAEPHEGQSPSQLVEPATAAAEDSEEESDEEVDEWPLLQENYDFEDEKLPGRRAFRRKILYHARKILGNIKLRSKQGIRHLDMAIVFKKLFANYFEAVDQNMADVDELGKPGNLTQENFKKFRKDMIRRDKGIFKEFERLYCSVMEQFGGATPDEWDDPRWEEINKAAEANNRRDRDGSGGLQQL